MFNFLNSTVLFAAVAALIPLLIHLFSRRRVKIIEFSSLKHLKAMQRRQVRRLKIRQLLLLILRMLIILLVVMAFARPTTRGGALGSHASVSAVILLDNSASMNRYVTDGNLFDIAKARTTKLLGTFGESDEVTLIPMVRDASETGARKAGSAALAVEKLGRTKVTNEEADLEGSLQSAADLLANAKHLNKEIYIVSDRQRSSLPDKQILSDSKVRVFFVDLPIEDNDDIGVTSVDFGGQLIMPGHDFDIVAKVNNYGSQDRDDIIASLFVDDRRVAQTDVSVAAGEDAEVRFTHAVSRTGFHSGRVELSDDKFQVDNNYNFAFGIPDQFNLLLIKGNSAANFIRLALAPSAEINQYWSVKEASPDNLTGINFFDYDVILVTGVNAIDPTFARRLRGYARGGKSVFVAYGGETDIAQFNSLWSELTGVRFVDSVKTNFTRAGYYSLQSFDAGHPIFTVFNVQSNELPEIKFYTLPRVELLDSAKVIMRFSGDRPALIERPYGRGKVITFAGPIDPRYSDLTEHAFFVPLMSRIAEYLASDLSSYDLKLFAGSNVTRSVTMRDAVSGNLEMTAPDSSRYDITPKDDAGAVRYTPWPVGEAGIYRVSYHGREIDRFAVNVNPKECDLTAVDTDQMATAIGAKSYNELKGGVDMAAVISKMRFGKELWQIFLWIAVVLIAIEMLLSRGAPAEE
jgi:hypothetical protein